MDRGVGSTRHIAVWPCKKAHKGRPGRVNGGLAKKSEPPLRFRPIREPDVFAHHPGDLRVSAQRRQFDDDQVSITSSVELLSKLDVHVVVHHAGEAIAGD